MTAPTINEDADLCFVCRRAAATTYGMCERCFSRAVWYIDPLPWEQP